MGSLFSQPKYKEPAIPEAPAPPKPPPAPKPEKVAPAPTKVSSSDNAKQEVLTRKKFESGRDKTLLAQGGSQGKRKKKTLLGE